VLGSGVVLVGVVGSLLPVTVERAVDAMEAKLGASFESGRGPEGISGLLYSCVGVTGLKVPSRAKNVRPNRHRSQPQPSFQTQILLPLFLRGSDTPLHCIPAEHACA